LLPTHYSLRRAVTRGTWYSGEKKNFVKSILSHSGRAPSCVHVYGQSSELEPTFCECNHTHARVHPLTHSYQCAQCTRFSSTFSLPEPSPGSQEHTQRLHNARTHARTDGRMHPRTQACIHPRTRTRVLFAHMLADTFQDPTSVGPFADLAGRQVGRHAHVRAYCNTHITHARTHARTDGRMHPRMHACIHPRTRTVYTHVR
jgi:hypothetical protein